MVQRVEQGIVLPKQPPLARRRAPLLLPVEIPLALDPDDERAALEELADELADEWYVDLEDAFPDGATGLTEPLTASEEMQKMLELTDARDLPWLLLDDYGPLFLAGLAPAPVSPMWSAMWSEMPKEAQSETKRFQRLWKRFSEEPE